MTALNFSPADFPELDAQALAGYDFFIVMDKSGSMGFTKSTVINGSLWDEASELVQGIIAYASQVDDDGVTLTFFNKFASTYNNVDAEQALALFRKEAPSGGTLVSAGLKDALSAWKSNGRPGVIITVLDGDTQGNDKTECARVITQAVNSLNRKEDLTFLFIQVGHDEQAAAFLDYLDDNLPDAKFDCVDAINADTAEQLTFGQMIGKAMND